MSEVKYSVNDKFFKDFGVYISNSDGLFDALKRKKINSYNWNEYHGLSVDLSNPKFEQRSITLKGFVIGSDWEEMKLNFDSIVEEFQKSGTQRLFVEPFGSKPLLYEVYLEDEVKLDKKFKQGKMIGVFSINLIEPNPLKIVYYTDLEIIDISFNSSYETEIFWGDGTKSVFSSNVNELKDYAFPSYISSGYTLISTSTINANYYQLGFTSTSNVKYEFSVKVNLPTAKNIKLYVIGKKTDNSLEVIAESSTIYGIVGENKLKVVSELNTSNYSKIYYKVLDDLGAELSGNVLSNPRIEKAHQMGSWQNMAGKRKYIILAGNIEKINNISTNADLLWTKL